MTRLQEIALTLIAAALLLGTVALGILRLYTKT